MTFRLAALIVTLFLGFLRTPLSADAQPARKVYRLGMILTSAPSAAFENELRNLGYIEGQNVVIQRRYSEGRIEQVPKLATEIVQFRPDVILVANGEMAVAVRRATTTIPVVVAAASDLVAHGIVKSLAKPGGNITGLQIVSVDLAGKRLELLREAVPNAQSVAILVPLIHPKAFAAQLRETETAARALGMQLHVLRLQDHRDLAPAFTQITSRRHDGLIVYANPFTHLHRRQITDLASTSRVPALYEYREFVDAGGLMSYGPSIPALYGRAARYVDKILKGAKPGDLPVEQPMKFELVVNMRTAKALGLTIPPSVLVRADQVIE